MQLSAIPVPVLYTPIPPVAPVAAVKGREAEGDASAAKPRAAPPPGVGILLDLQA